jgi:hypothetical protein
LQALRRKTNAVGGDDDDRDDDEIAKGMRLRYFHSVVVSNRVIVVLIAVSHSAKARRIAQHPPCAFYPR